MFNFCTHWTNSSVPQKINNFTSKCVHYVRISKPSCRNHNKTFTFSPIRMPHIQCKSLYVWPPATDNRFNTSNQLTNLALVGIYHLAKTVQRSQEKYKPGAANLSVKPRQHRNFTEGEKLPYKAAPNLAWCVSVCVCVGLWVTWTGALTHSVQAAVNPGHSSWHIKTRSRIHKMDLGLLGAKRSINKSIYGEIFSPKWHNKDPPHV